MEKFEFPNKERNESGAAFAGRRKRMINEWNRAQDFKEGDVVTVGFGASPRRFNFRMIDPHSPSVIYHASAEGVAILEAKEAERSEEKAYQAERDRIRSQPHVQVADSVRWLIESNLVEVADRMSLEEWQALYARLEVSK